MKDTTHMTDLTLHHAPATLGDRIALRTVKFMRIFADAFFSKRYGHRAVVLETVAAVPGMVGGLLQHLKALRHIRDDQGWIRELLEEADNERMHLMTFIQVAQPSRFERMVIMVGQLIFYNAYFWLYLFAPRIAHRPPGSSTWGIWPGSVRSARISAMIAAPRSTGTTSRDSSRGTPAISAAACSRSATTPIAGASAGRR